MASFDDLFGSGAKSGGQKYIKWEAVDTALYFIVTGEPDPRHPQVDFKSGKKKYLVKYHDQVKYMIKQEGEFSDNDENVENSFLATTLMVPVQVFRKVLPNGQDEEGFEPFEAEWIPNPDQVDKLKDQMLETKIPLEKGTIVAVKYLMDGKPRKYMVRLAQQES